MADSVVDLDGLMAVTTWYVSGFDDGHLGWARSSSGARSRGRASSYPDLSDTGVEGERSVELRWRRIDWYEFERLITRAAYGRGTDTFEITWPAEGLAWVTVLRGAAPPGEGLRPCRPQQEQKK